MEEVTRDWRKLDNEDFYNLCTSPNIVGIFSLLYRAINLDI
jgi:hypothetical protein